MCGIAGFYNFRNTPPETAAVQKMLAVMQNRGPDGEGIRIMDTVALGHRRLAIIDLISGAQPIENEDGSIAVILNGEIFNYREWRPRLEAGGHVFKTDSDTETIVHLYEEYGNHFMDYLDGFFAIALYDRNQRKLILVRDRLGVKPLVYFETADTVVFASTLEALKQHPAFPDELAPQAIWDYLSLQYVPHGTIYRQVHRLEPGHFLEITDHAVQIRSFWQADYTHKLEISYQEACAELDKRVRKAVSDRLIADVPLGVFLSGGLDSTIIAGLTAELTGKPLTCYSIAFREAAYDERRYAAENAAHIRDFARHGFQHKIREVDPCNMELLKQLIRQYGEPFADASLIPTALLSRFAREEVTVALSGDGADEVFRGYERYLAMRYLSRFDFIPSSLRKFVFQLLCNCIPDRGGERGKIARGKRFLQGAALSGAARYLGIISHTDEKLKRRFCGDFFSQVQPTIQNFDAGHYLQTADHTPELDLHTYLPGDILTKADTASMSASLELRSPFLDHPVVEFAASLPESFKEQHGFRKRILAETFARYLPPGLATRRKRGFGVPLADWFRHEWKDILLECLPDGECVHRGIFTRAGMEQLIAEHQQGLDRSYALYSALVLELFWQ